MIVVYYKVKYSKICLVYSENCLLYIMIVVYYKVKYSKICLVYSENCLTLRATKHPSDQ